MNMFLPFIDFERAREKRVAFINGLNADLKAMAMRDAPKRIEELDEIEAKMKHLIDTSPEALELAKLASQRQTLLTMFECSEQTLNGEHDFSF